MPDGPPPDPPPPGADHRGERGDDGADLRGSDRADLTGDGAGLRGDGVDGEPDREAGEPDRGAGEGSVAGKDPLRFSSWMKRSAAGAVMTGIAVGLHEALEPERPAVPFVIEAPGDPHDPDGRIDLRFDPDSPSGTVAVIRQSAGDEAADGAAGPAADPPATGP